MKTIIIFLILSVNIFSIGDKVYNNREKNRSDRLTLHESENLLKLDLNKLYSDKKLGAFIENGTTIFRVFAPSAKTVSVCLYQEPDQEKPEEYVMKADADGVWEKKVEGELYGSYYLFKVTGRNSAKAHLCLDPYAKAVTTFNTYMNVRKGIIIKEDDFNWEGDEPIIRDWRDLIIYEMHIRDLTAHNSSGAEHPGTYKGLVEKGKKGGIDYIKALGVNAVELLPAQEFANIEIPYRKSMAGRTNTWNPYERNHWGYMTAAFFAPEAYFSEDWNELKWNTWMGSHGKQVNDFKEMVKAFHKEGISVIMDVVYNHISEYELGNLKEIDSEYYFRLDKNGHYIAQSGCGNDFKTERPMARRMIIESILYWMKEYHIDGFRFDLGRLIDWETVEEIIREARKVNPNVVIVCEPWGGGYDPEGFSLREWGSWNDQIRNGIKGENPENGLGWIFGSWFGNNDPQRIKSYVNGTLVRDRHGLFQKKEHSVNYLESHDGYTLGDFIRIGLKEIDTSAVIKDVDKHAVLSDKQKKLNKLAALFLFTSQGITMISEGQEFARSKVIPYDLQVTGEHHKGKIDHNSYNKDNATNYLNYNHADLNRDLVEYYKGLIRLRNKYAAFRRADYEDVKFHPFDHNPFSLAFSISYEDNDFIVMFNAHNNIPALFTLPDGEWNMIVNPEAAGVDVISKTSGKVEVKPKEGYVFIKVK